MKQYNAEWYEANRNHSLTTRKKHYRANRTATLEKSRIRKLARRNRVLDAYGRVCACCGIDQPEFLTIDHINNDGAEHRRIIGVGGLYGWLEANGYPAGFQTLCWNCNISKFRVGVCPHETNRLRSSAGR